MGLKIPTQMRRTGGPIRAIAQQKQGCAAFGRAQAQPPAGREIEQIGRPAYISDNAGDRPAGQSLLGYPKQIRHIGSPHHNQLIGIKAEGQKARPIGQSEKLRVIFQLQVEHRHAPGCQQRPHLPQGKGKASTAIAHGIGAHILQEPAR